jgi:hypothetical protein
VCNDVRAEHVAISNLCARKQSRLHRRVNYDLDRTEGLTNKDIIESLAETSGVPVLASVRTRAGPPAERFPDRIVLAQWENAESVLTLLRGAYAPEFQLILMSKSLDTRARSAISEAIRGRISAVAPIAIRPWTPRISPSNLIRMRDFVPAVTIDKLVRGPRDS